MTGGTQSDWHLHDQRDLLRRSLEDADREHGAGDLTDEDYALLRARDERRLAEVDAAIAAVDAAPTAAPTHAAADGETGARRTTPSTRRFVRWHRRWWLAATGVALVVAATVLLVVELTSPRLPGQDATGSISLNTAQQIERQLAQAKGLVAQGKATRAVALYGQVLAEDPKQPVALAEWGWLDWESATRAKQQTAAAEGASALVEAVKIDPRLFAAQYYLGEVLLQEGAARKAVVHFAAFLADSPTARWLREAAPAIRAAYAGAHRQVPSGVPGA